MAAAVFTIEVKDESGNSGPQRTQPGAAPPPTQPSPSSGTSAAGDLPDWYAEFHTLKNAADILAEAGKSLAGTQAARLAELERLLTAEVGRSASDRAAGQKAGSDTADMRRWLGEQDEFLAKNGIKKERIAESSDDAIRELVGMLGYEPPRATGKPQPAAAPPQPAADRSNPSQAAGGDVADMRRWLGEQKDFVKAIGLTKENLEKIGDDAVRQLVEQIGGYTPPGPAGGIGKGGKGGGGRKGGGSGDGGSGAGGDGVGGAGGGTGGGKGGGGGGGPPDGPDPGKPAADRTPGKAARDTYSDALQELQAIRDRLTRGALSVEEALKRVASVIRKNADEITDRMRDKGIISTDQTAESYWKDLTVKTGASAGAYMRPAKVSQDVLDKEAEKAAKEEAKAQAAEEKARLQKMRDVASGVRTMAGGGMEGKLAGLNQIAGTGALGESAAAMAGPEVGAALAIMDAVKGVISGAGQSAREGLQTVGEMAKKAAGNDGFGALEMGVEAASRGLENTGIVGMVAAEGLRTATAAARVFGETLNTFAARGRELQGYSGAISSAAARSETASLMADIREARKYEGQYSKVIDLQSQFEQVGRDAVDPLKEAALDFLVKVGPSLLEAAQTIPPLVRAAVDIGKAVAPPVELLGVLLNAMPIYAVARMVATAAIMFKNTPPDNAENHDKDAMFGLDKLMEQLEQLRPQPGFRPIGPAAVGPNMPLPRKPPPMPGI